MQDRSKGRGLQLAKFVYGFIAYSVWLINFELAPLIERWLGRLQDLAHIVSRTLATLQFATRRN